jgi:hypothetical protein
MNPKIVELTYRLSKSDKHCSSKKIQISYPLFHFFKQHSPAIKNPFQQSIANIAAVLVFEKAYLVESHPENQCRSLLPTQESHPR